MSLYNLWLEMRLADIRLMRTNTR